jgi:hypothetical protein
MNKKHVILVANQSLLGDGLEKLLSENDQLCLYRVATLDYYLWGRFNSSAAISRNCSELR